ncbi:MAG: hypothetical protein WDN69_29505 [Aliidongia sp.]
MLAIVQNALVQIVRTLWRTGSSRQPTGARPEKPPQGRLAVSVSRRGRQIVFECSD